LVLAQPPFSKTSVTAIVSKAKSITVTATVTETAEERARTPLCFLLPRPHSRPCENLVPARRQLAHLNYKVGDRQWTWTMSARGTSITRGRANARGRETEKGKENGKGRGRGKRRERGIHETRSPFNAKGWVSSTQWGQHLYHARLTMGRPMGATLIPK